MKLKLFIIFLISLQITVFFQNCSSGFNTIDATSLSKSTAVKNDNQENSSGSSSNANNQNIITTPCTIENGVGQYLPQDGKCTISSCNTGFHLNVISLTCETDLQSCTQTNGIGQKRWSNGSWGSCQAISCSTNFHNDILTHSCIANTKDCVINGQNGNQTWNGSAWSLCTLSACPAGQHLENNICVQNTKACSVTNGMGAQSWSGSSWGICQITNCNANYHQDPASQTCITNSQNCQTSIGQGTQAWSNGAWGACQLQTCSPSFHVENANCISDNKTCTLDYKLGSQMWTGATWTSCLTCSESHTPLFNKCEPDYAITQRFASFLTSCWKDGVFTCPITAPMGYIGVPNKYFGDAKTNFQFLISYTGATEILLNPSHVILSGSGATGCQTSILPNSDSSKLVSITGCSGNGPLYFSITANSAKNQDGLTTPTLSTSTTVIVANSLPTIPYTQIQNLEYIGKLEKQKFDFYYPNDFKNRQNIPVLIWLHGGGWVGGSKESDFEIVQKFAKLGFLIINANYTLSNANLSGYPQLTLPQTPYSVGLDDVQGLVNSIKTTILPYNGDINKISIAGGSAGGHLALFQATRSDNMINFQCVISAAGPSDLVSGSKNQAYYPYTQFIINSVFGNNSSDLVRNSPALQMAYLKTNKLLLSHQVQDNIVPIDNSLRVASQVYINKPNVALYRFFQNDQNLSPLFNPQPAEATHIESPDIGNGLASFIFTECQ